MSQRKDINWTTHYTFISIPNNTYFIKKNELATWEDLVYALGEEIRLQYEFIQILINQKRVDYERNTNLVDIDINQDDVCIVAKRKKFENKQEREEYQSKSKQLRIKCMKELSRDEEYPEIKQIIKFVQTKYESAFQTLGKKYGRIISAVALYNREYEKEEGLIKAYIQSGDAARFVRRIIVENERKYLQIFLNKKEIKELKDKIFKNLKQFDQFAYRAIIQELYNVYPDFKRLEFRYRKLVKKYFFEGKYLEEKDYEQQQQQQQQSQEKDYRFTEKKRAKDQFKQKMRMKSFKDKDINEAIYQAGNDYRKAEYLLSNDLVYSVQNKPFLIKQAGRINYLLQFLANPKFEKVRQRLAKDKKKASSFLQWIRDQNKDKPALCELIESYKEYAVSFLAASNLEINER